MLKQAFYFLLLLFFPVFLAAQQADSTSIIKLDSLVVTADSTSLVKLDSIAVAKDSIKVVELTAQQKLKNTIKENKWLNLSGKPLAMKSNFKKRDNQDIIFYALLSLVAILGFLRFFYIQYFNNLFRVFFNSSLRQSQLTDQLLQAKLQSLFFNIIFFLSGGLFSFFLLQYFSWLPSKVNSLLVILFCSICTATVYFLKFLVLKFTGWLTGYKEVTNIYIFIIFLINKILGILLIPLIIVIAFSESYLIKIALLVAVVVIALMFLLRIFRSYGLLQHQLKIGRLHFFMYIAGIEILPVLLIYKGLVLLLSKNL